MELLDPGILAQYGALGINGAVALILYGIRRDLRDHAATHRRHWFWLEKMRRKLWPETFGPDETEPQHDAP